MLGQRRALQNGTTRDRKFAEPVSLAQLLSHTGESVFCRFLQGAACHWHLFLAETSCAQQNDLLDHTLVVWTGQDQGAEFFQ